MTVRGRERAVVALPISGLLDHVACGDPSGQPGPHARASHRPAAAARSGGWPAGTVCSIRRVDARRRRWFVDMAVDFAGARGRCGGGRRRRAARGRASRGGKQGLSVMVGPGRFPLRRPRRPSAQRRFGAASAGVSCVEQQPGRVGVGVDDSRASHPASLATISPATGRRCRRAALTDSTTAFFASGNRGRLQAGRGRRCRRALPWAWSVMPMVSDVVLDGGSIRGSWYTSGAAGMFMVFSGG